MAHWSWTRAARRTACRRIDDRHIEWTEEGIRIGAEIAELTADRLRLRIQLRSEIKEESYRPAKVPSVCPDMPRREGPVPGH
jgi:L-alanine-DL-glutamate epimerase-like enolase superfamily enzyme